MTNKISKGIPLDSVAKRCYNSSINSGKQAAHDGKVEHSIFIFLDVVCTIAIYFYEFNLLYE